MKQQIQCTARVRKQQSSVSYSTACATVCLLLLCLSLCRHSPRPPHTYST
jgi:hypothetical protein